MNRNHPPVLRIAAMITLLVLAVAGGPVVLALMIMAIPSVIIFAVMVRAVFGGGSARTVKHN